MDNLTIGNFEYRIKKMNAIELLAMQTQMDFDSFDNAVKCYDTILEKIEVKMKDNWLQVKETGKNLYYPASVEEDFDTVAQLIKYFMDYMKSVFLKSNESNEKTE